MGVLPPSPNPHPIVPAERQGTEEEQTARRWYNVALEQQQAIQQQQQSAAQLAAQLEQRLEQERLRYATDSQQAQALIEGAHAAT